MTWRFASPEVVYGDGALSELSDLSGDHALVVTDENMIELGYAERIQELLEKGDMDYAVYSEIEPEPSYEAIRKGKDEIAKYESDVVIGLGGGSCMGAAKAIRILYDNPDISLDAIGPNVDFDLERKLVLIPTTSGTGAEATEAMVLTNEEEERKTPTTNKYLRADLALVDNSLVMDLPSELTASTAADALSHSIDAYISNLKNDFSDALGIKAVEMVFDYLPTVYEDGSDEEARKEMHIAATMGGLAFGNAQAGLSHGLAHSIGAVFHIPHGKACGLCLPYSIEFEAKEVPDLLAEIGRYIGIRGDEEEVVNKLEKKIRETLKSVDIPQSLEEAGISREEFESNLEKLVMNTNMDSTTALVPRIPSNEEIRKIYEYIFEGKEVDF